MPSCLDLNLYSYTIHCNSHALSLPCTENVNQPLGIALVVVTAKLWLHYYTGQTFKLTGVWLTHIKEFGIPPDYYHIHWFSLRCFRSSIAITCCAAVYQNRLSKSTASEEKREFHFPYDTCLCKASLTTHTLSGLQFSLINLTSGQHRARVSRIKSRIQFVLAWAQTCKLQSGAKKIGVMGLSSHSPWVTVGK